SGVGALGVNDFAVVERPASPGYRLIGGLCRPSGAIGRIPFRCGKPILGCDTRRVPSCWGARFNRPLPALAKASAERSCMIEATLNSYRCPGKSRLVDQAY